jgi:hypothetical protein
MILIGKDPILSRMSRALIGGPRRSNLLFTIYDL